MAIIDWEKGESSGFVSLQTGSRIFASIYGPDRSPGDPIVIVIPGVTCSITEWAVVRRQLQTTTRILLYERSGIGESDESPEERTAANIALELGTLLKTMGIAPPYVFVCHSYGGIISRELVESFQKQNRGEDVAGMVFVDANQEKSTALWPDSNLWPFTEGLDFYAVMGLAADRALTDTEWKAMLDEEGSEKHQRNAKREMEHYIQSCALLGTKNQLDRKPPLLGNAPLSVLLGHPEIETRRMFEAGIQNGKGTPEQREQFSKKLDSYGDTNRKFQQENLRLSTKHRFVDVEGHGHFIHITAPEKVVEEILWVLQNI